MISQNEGGSACWPIGWALPRGSQASVIYSRPICSFRGVFHPNPIGVNHKKTMEKLVKENKRQNRITDSKQTNRIRNGSRETPVRDHLEIILQFSNRQIVRSRVPIPTCRYTLSFREPMEALIKRKSLVCGVCILNTEQKEKRFLHRYEYISYMH